MSKPTEIDPSDMDLSQFETVEIDPSDMDLSQFEPVENPEISDEGISKKLSALLGGIQGATFDFGDEIRGGLSYAAEPLKDIMESGIGVAEDISGEELPSVRQALTSRTKEESKEYEGYQGMLKQYQENRDRARAEVAAAEEANPMSYLAGDIAGSIGTGIVTGSGLASLAARGAKLGSIGKLGKGALKFLSPTNVGKFNTVGQAAKASALEGARFGALKAAGQEEGGIVDIGKSAASGATIGMLAGGVLGAAGQGVRNFTGGALDESFRLGKKGVGLDDIEKGIDLDSKLAPKTYGQFKVKTIQEARDLIKERTNELGLDKKKVYEILENFDKKVDVSDDLGKVLAEVDDELSSFVNKQDQQASKLQEFLEPYMGVSEKRTKQRMRETLQQKATNEIKANKTKNLKNLIPEVDVEDGVMYGNVDIMDEADLFKTIKTSPEKFLQDIDSSSLTPGQLQNLTNKLNALQEKTPELGSTIKGLLGKIKIQRNTQLDSALQDPAIRQELIKNGLDPDNISVSGLFKNTEEALSSLRAMFGDPKKGITTKITKDLEDIGTAIKNISSGDPTKELKYTEQIIGYLDNNFGEQGKRIAQDFNTIKSLDAIFGRASKDISGNVATSLSAFGQVVLGGLGQAIPRAAHFAGSVSAIPANIVKSVTPDVLQRMASASAGTPIGQVLAKAIKESPKTRNAILYGLAQQPAFRQMIKDSTDGEE